MNWTSRVWGWFVLLLGTVGVIACLTSGLLIWTVHFRVDGAVKKTFARVDLALVRLGDRAQQTNERIDEIHESLGQLNDRVQAKVAEKQGIAKEDAADIDEIERQLYARMQHVGHWIEFLRSTVELIEQVFEMTESVSAFVQGDQSATQGLLTTLRAGQSEFDQTGKLLDEVKQSLAEARGSRDFSKTAERLTTVSERIGTSLTKIQGYGEEFEAGVTKTRNGSEELGSRIRWRLLLIAVILTLFVAWMGFGQYCLAARGRKILWPR